MIAQQMSICEEQAYRLEGLAVVVFCDCYEQPVVSSAIVYCWSAKEKW
jgi:hypothetical protein